MVMESIDCGDFKCPFGVRTSGKTSGTWLNRFAVWLYANKNIYYQIGKDEATQNTVLNNNYTNTKFHIVAENG